MYTMNIFGSKSGHLNNSKLQGFLHFPQNFAICDDFSEFCSTFGTLHFEKSSNTAKKLEQMKKNVSIILSLKWPLLEPKMFIVHWVNKLLSKGCKENQIS